MFEGALYDEYECEAEKITNLKMYDALRLEIKPVEQFYTLISFDYTDIKTFTNVLTERLSSLLLSLKATDLYIISHLKFDIFGTLNNNYPPLKKALLKTAALLPNLKYNEALRVDLQDLPLFIETFFWIGRCDATAPEYIYFADVKDRFAFSICKYGYIHFIEFEKEILDDEILTQLNLFFVDNCQEKFSKKQINFGKEILNLKNYTSS